MLPLGEKSNEADFTGYFKTCLQSIYYVGISLYNPQIF